MTKTPKTIMFAHSHDKFREYATVSSFRWDHHFTDDEFLAFGEELLKRKTVERGDTVFRLERPALLDKYLEGYRWAAEVADWHARITAADGMIPEAEYNNWIEHSRLYSLWRRDNPTPKVRVGGREWETDHIVMTDSRTISMHRQQRWD